MSLLSDVRRRWLSRRGKRDNMRSWQRALALGGALLVTGAGAVFVHDAQSEHTVTNLTVVAGLVFLGVGGSLIATALVARLVADQVFGIDTSAALEALRGSTQLAREKQTLEITLEEREGLIVAEGKHVFCLQSVSRLTQLRWLSLYTDVGTGGGFMSVREPNGRELKGAELASYVELVEGKSQFRKRYLFHASQPAPFVVQTVGGFQRADRLIWTVEHISRDFRVCIVDRRILGSPITVKINHHRREAISGAMEQDIRPSGARELRIDFLGEVLPYQGFELGWRDDPVQMPGEST